MGSLDAVQPLKIFLHHYLGMKKTTHFRPISVIPFAVWHTAHKRHYCLVPGEYYGSINIKIFHKNRRKLEINRARPLHSKGRVALS